MSNKMKQEYTFLIEFSVKNKKDCEKLLKVIKLCKNNILKSVYTEKEVKEK